LGDLLGSHLRFYLPLFTYWLSALISFPKISMSSTEANVLSSGTEGNAIRAVEFELEWAHEFSIDVSGKRRAYATRLFSELDGYRLVAGGYMYQNVSRVELKLRKPRGVDTSFAFCQIPDDLTLPDAKGAEDPKRWFSTAFRQPGGTADFSSASNTAVESYILSARPPPQVSTTANHPLPPFLKPRLLFAIEASSAFPSDTTLDGRISGVVRVSGHGYHAVA
jgi:hypothetical protein